MPGNKKVVSTARTKNNKAAIAPPSDLWERLDLDFEAHRPPADGITVPQYAARYGISHAKALCRIENLVNSGILTLVGKYGSKGTKYYRLNR